MKTLYEIPHGSHVMIDARTTDYIDPDIMDFIVDFEKETAPAHNLTLSLVGFKDHYKLRTRFNMSMYPLETFKSRRILKKYYRCSRTVMSGL
jgi:hypothetical protein